MPRIRRAVPADAAGVARVHVDSWRVAYRGILQQDYLDQLVVEERRELWHRILTGEAPPPAPPTSMTLVVEYADDICGFVSIGPARADPIGAAPSKLAPSDPTLPQPQPNDLGEVYALYLHPRSWGIGWGAALFDAGLVQLIRAGHREGVLWVAEANRRARDFYQRVGWAPDGATQVERIGGVDMPEVRYRGSLSAPSPDARSHGTGPRPRSR